MLLEALDAHDARAARPLGPDLCELYANDRFVEFGRPLAARCLDCHAGAKPQPFDAAKACADCHGEIHRRWSGSAHAQSLSHLRLSTVSAETRQPQAMDFGPIRGITCQECHRPTNDAAVRLPADAARPAACPYTFQADTRPGGPCARCHATTAAEWQAWLKGRQPRPARWPPGQIDTEYRGDTRTCADCHMPRPADVGEKAPPRHDWSVRRDLRRLREGLAMSLALASLENGQPAIRLTLVNLSGHAYPTGTRRRALRIWAGPTGGDRDQRVADLSPVRPGRFLAEAQPALAPGEARVVLIAPPAGVGAVTARLQYCRDVTDPKAYVADIASAEEDARRWAAP